MNLNKESVYKTLKRIINNAKIHSDDTRKEQAFLKSAHILVSGFDLAHDPHTGAITDAEVIKILKSAGYTRSDL